MGRDQIKQTVKEKYGQAALRVAGGERGSCGGTGTCGCDPVSSNLYDAAETAALPEGAVLASLGCGNPTALAELHEGEVVLDLGSGGGDRKSTRLNSSHSQISYAVFCLK